MLNGIEENGIVDIHIDRNWNEKDGADLDMECLLKITTGCSKNKMAYVQYVGSRKRLQRNVLVAQKIWRLITAMLLEKFARSYAHGATPLLVE